jgi:hypothetical protein
MCLDAGRKTPTGVRRNVRHNISTSVLIATHPIGGGGAAVRGDDGFPGWRARGRPLGA